MREILFRGKRADNGEWVEGYYGQFHNRPVLDRPNSHQIFEPMEDATVFGSAIGGLWYTIIPETLGQYTGLTDKNGTKIFEGDIVKIYEYVYVCFWNECNCEFGLKNDKEDFGIAYAPRDIEVIGNIHDTPNC